MKDPGAPLLNEMIHRIALCSQKDVVLNSSTMELKRTEVIWVWARVRSHYGLPAFLGQQGYSIMDPVTKATHAITIRTNWDILVTDTAYAYEEFRKSPPRWYKVLGWSEIDDGFTTLQTRIAERSDFALPPQGALAPQPSQVEL
jgi:hypothetical protein